MYTAMAIEGLDTNGDGIYSREELAELAKVNMDGLKEFDYFTFVKLGDTTLKLKEPVDYWLEHKGGVLSLYFTLPLAEPVLADAPGFSFSVYDPSFFIAFDLVKDDPVKLSGGAPGCAAHVEAPAQGSDVQALGNAFSNQLGPGSWGGSMAKSISVSCHKS
jgi:ABC-type uncharacterized transport system substrate-binding protein